MDRVPGLLTQPRQKWVGNTAANDSNYGHLALAA